jgi:hypothetical protein
MRFSSSGRRCWTPRWYFVGVGDADGMAALVQVEPDKRTVNRQLDVKPFTLRSTNLHAQVCAGTSEGAQSRVIEQ